MESVILFVAVFSLVGIYVMTASNRLVRLRNDVKNALVQIEVQLKRRYELLPNIVEASKISMKDERETLENLIRTRNQALSSMDFIKDQMNSETLQKLFQAEAQVCFALKQFSVVLENYPDLKANATLKLAMAEISTIENKVVISRQAFNDSVRLYNTKRETFPANLVANAFGFSILATFEIQNVQELEAVKVS